MANETLEQPATPERVGVGSKELLDASVPIGSEGNKMYWTVRELLAYWRTNGWSEDGIKIETAVHDLRQLARLLLP